MHIRVILTLIWLGCISLNTLLADKLPESSAGKEGKKQAPAESLEADTLFSGGEQINLPFIKSNRKFFTGSAVTIAPEELLKYNSVNDVSSLLTGFVPGSFGGTDIRGLGDALVLIDGINRPISSIDIEEIAEITILKDVNAAILYGVQANNGLILITTKRGQPGTKSVKLSFEQGYGKPLALPNYLGAADYMELYNEARTNDGLVAQYSQDQIDGTRSGTNPARFPDADYYTSEFLKGSKPNSRLFAQFSGGNENAQYHISTGWLHDGTLLNMGEGAKDKDDRLSLRSNVDFKVTDFLKSRVDVGAAWDLARRFNGNFWSDASSLRPNLYTPLIDTAMISNEVFIKKDRFINGRYVAGGRAGYLNNIWANLNFGGYYNQTNTTVQFSNMNDVDLKVLTKGLRFKTFVAFDFYNQYRETLFHSYSIYEPSWSNEDVLTVKRIGEDVNSSEKGLASTVLMRNLSFYGLLDYSRMFGENHSLNASLIAYSEYYTQTAILQPRKNNHLGFRVNYANQNRYLVDFSSAIVTSPKLHKDNRIGFSRSLGLGWIMSEESFLKDNSAIDFLKLKFSASNMKTDVAIPGHYLHAGTFQSSSSFSWDDSKSSLPSAIALTETNSNLFYESRKEINAGLEAALANHSLWLDANFFIERNSDLVSQPVNTYPDYMGGIFPWENYGEEKYTGFEIGATWRKPLSSDFNIEIGGNMVYVKTKVVKIDERYEYDYLYRTGKPIGAMFGLEAIGLFKDQADIDNHSEQTFGNVIPGDIKYKDQNGDNIIDIFDEVMIGNSDPTFYGALHLKMKYKGFSLFALGTGRSGSERYFNNAYYWVYGDRKYSDVVWNRWTPETAATATYPRLTTQSSSNNFRASTFWLENNALIKFNRLQLTYDVPENTAARFLTRNLSIYARADNILTLAKNRDKMDLNIGSEPQYRYYALGLKASF